MNSNQAIEALIRRHEEGDRSPELLQQLDTMAREVLLGVPGPGATGGVELVKAYLRHTGEPFFCPAPRVYSVAQPYSEAAQRSTQIRHYIEGAKDEFYRLAWLDDREIPLDRCYDALSWANKWNRFIRWPRAVVEGTRRGEDGEYEALQFCLDYQLNLTHGIPEDLFIHLVGCAIGAGRDFWDDLQREGF